MISHALTIVINELNRHLADIYGNTGQDQAGLGNLAEGFGAGSGSGISRNMLYLSVVNITEEKTMTNLPNQIRNDATLRVTYENPPIFINLLILMTATHTDYTNALSVLSRAIRFFQSRNVFTQDTVAPDSITTSSVPINPLDTLESFKLIFDLYSPTLEEVNHLWGTLGGKQYPFVLYKLRMLDLKFKAVQSEGGLITEVVSDFHTKS
ncbi:MAG: DUF4255 domain-containing protein [Thioploca sp.]|nr:DUF4255 domain-containing protein [Thioploca sp.]